MHHKLSNLTFRRLKLKSITNPQIISVRIRVKSMYMHNRNQRVTPHVCMFMLQYYLQPTQNINSNPLPLILASLVLYMLNFNK